MYRLGFDAPTSLFEQAKTVHSLDRATSLISKMLLKQKKNLTPWPVEGVAWSAQRIPTAVFSDF
jgi:hypothetical protein